MCIYVKKIYIYIKIFVYICIYPLTGLFFSTSLDIDRVLIDPSEAKKSAAPIATKLLEAAKIDKNSSHGLKLLEIFEKIMKIL